MTSVTQHGPLAIVALLLLATAASVACETRSDDGVTVRVTATPSPRFTEPKSCSEALDLIVNLDPYVYQRIDYHAENGATEDVLADDEFLLEQLQIAQSYFDLNCD